MVKKFVKKPRSRTVQKKRRVIRPPNYWRLMAAEFEQGQSIISGRLEGLVKALGIKLRLQPRATAGSLTEVDCRFREIAAHVEPGNPHCVFLRTDHGAIPALWCVGALSGLERHCRGFGGTRVANYLGQDHPELGLDGELHSAVLGAWFVMCKNQPSQSELEKYLRKPIDRHLKLWRKRFRESAVVQETRSRSTEQIAFWALERMCLEPDKYLGKNRWNLLVEEARAKDMLPDKWTRHRSVVLPALLKGAVDRLQRRKRRLAGV